MDRKVDWGEGVFAFLDELLEGDVHGKRVLSLANATLGVMVSASLAVAVIGRSLAQARGLLTRHAIKQVDRLLSNQAIDPWDIAARWVPEIVGSATDIQVVMDWTDFDADGQTTLALNKVMPHGRATPLLWLTVMKDDLNNKRNAYEDACLKKLAEVLPAGVKVTILADHGFGDTKLFGYLGTLGFDYVIRFRGNTHVRATTGERRPAADWVGKGGRAIKLSGAALTASEHPVGAVVCVQARDMKETWPGHQPFRRHVTRDRRRLCEALDDRAQLPRHKGHQVRHGVVAAAHLAARPARSTVAHQCLRGPPAHHAGHRRRGARDGSSAQVRHQQPPHTFRLPPGLHALRPHPQHARGTPPPPPAALRRGDATIRRNPEARRSPVK